MQAPDYQTHNETYVPTNGTSLKGYTIATYYELVELFGEPTQGDPAKTQAEWEIEFEDGTMATIYDWKMYGIPVEQIGEWNIGGKDSQAVELVEQVIQAYRKSDAEPKTYIGTASVNVVATNLDDATKQVKDALIQGVYDLEIIKEEE